jgi:hypothetical protein
MEWAKTARSEQQRDALLEMARIWHEAAHHADGSELKDAIFILALIPAGWRTRFYACASC